jgi:DNA-binding beta-propeller fold protein YncE
MNRRRRPNTAVPLLAAALLSASCAAGPATPPEGAPDFEVDPTWPQPLPNDWIMGLPLGIHVDSRDHIWVVQNSDVLDVSELGAAQDPPIAECCFPAPPVLVLDPDGHVIQSWGGPGAGYRWPRSAHGIFVDHNDFVWIASNNDHHVLKFTREGEHVLTIGDPDRSGGSNDPDRLGGAADAWVDPETNELYLADGYRNRRVVVYDAQSGEYQRHWGAYGEPPEDAYEPGPRGSDAPPARQFSTVHGIIGSNDGLLYVADRSNSRVQVFRKDGEFVAERNVAPGTLGSGAAFDVADGTNNKVRILDRQDLEIVGEFGRAGRQIGQFTRIHNLAVDSQGRIYTTEAADGRRVQRFRPQTTAGR